MAIFKNERFLDHRTTEAFQLDISAEGEPERLVTFADPNRLPIEKAFELQTDADEKPTLFFEALLGEDFEAFWDVWRKLPADAVTNLVKAVTDHFRRPSA